MNVEQALIFLDTALQQRVLSNLQELVFCQAWAGQTYPEIAESSGYDANYIKDVGYKLWKLLSTVFEEEVTKSNFRSVIRRKYIAFKQAYGELSNTFAEDSISVSTNINISHSPKAKLLKARQYDVATKALSSVRAPQKITAHTQRLVGGVSSCELTPAQNWVEATDILALYGRREGLDTLKQWISG